MRKLVPVLLALFAVTAARGADHSESWAVRESLSRVHPRLRSRWLAERGLVIPGENAPLSPVSDSCGLRLVGKFGRGPSVEVTGRDSLVFLSLGSEVAIINMADPDNPEVLSEPQAMGLVTQAAVRDSFLYIGCVTGESGIEVWNIEDPSDPVFRSRTSSLLSDFCINDTFLYLTQSNSGLNDTFKVYSIADPENLRLLGTCRDSGDVVTYANNAAFLGDRWGLYAVDVSNPANPHRVGSFGIEPISVEARGNICCATAYISSPGNLAFDVLDVSNPAAIVRLGRLSDAGGYDICLVDTLALLSGYSSGNNGFRIVDISDSTQPRLVGSLTRAGVPYGVWAKPVAPQAYVASRERGLAQLDITDIANPTRDTSLLLSGWAEDVCVDEGYCYVASDGYGLVIVDVTAPSEPLQVGTLDTNGYIYTHTVAARDSFAYMGYFPLVEAFQVVDVSDPTQPLRCAGVEVFNQPEDMVLRDSFVYVAEANRLQVVNVARPREPVLVGSCGGDGVAIVVQDSFAYTAAGATRITNIARPDSPYVVATITGHGAGGIAVRDTFLYIPAGYDTVWVYSVAEPAAPNLLGITPMPCHLWDIALADSVAAVATVRGLDLLSLAHPASPVRLGGVTTPYGPRRVVWSEPYFYAAMWDAGVGIYAVESVGVSEPAMPEARPRVLAARPNPTRGRLQVQLAGGGLGEVRVWDAAGRCVVRQKVRGWQENVLLDLTDQKGGVYFIENCSSGRAGTVKVVKQ